MLKLRRLISPLFAAGLVLAPLSAQAGVLDGVLHHATGAVDGALGFLGLNGKESAKPAALAEAPATVSSPILSAPPVFSARVADIAELDVPSLPSVAVAELPSPSIETPLRRLFCVEYARARSGLAVFGDAKLWWARAKNLYARMAHPVSDSVMVFSGSKRLKRGHVAVVTHIVSAREIRVDQANWQNQGEIDLATPVLDVSKNNDWSQVRVWNMQSQGFGARVYAISGFISKNQVQKAGL